MAAKRYQENKMHIKWLFVSKIITTQNNQAPKENESAIKGRITSVHKNDL
ncbi:hypothetical protein KFK09_027783 [Dendrobium nobile]|uniref:Uncharacterized protein n=1 Tax=Dendrobium nobile TaxID=94219 RepID=A0A8T3A1N2_DENNO|nr:hypothetical protein KFK09_027783 [Dendrobium nobile]